MTTTRATRAKGKNKHLILDQSKLNRAKKLLGAESETETVELALDMVIAEAETNKKAWAAHGDSFAK